MLADEPTGNLDSDTSNDIIALFERINKEEGTTILIVTHDLQTVKEFPKRTIELSSGHIIRDLPNGLVNESIPKNINSDDYFDTTAKLYFKEEIKKDENV